MCLDIPILRSARGEAPERSGTPRTICTVDVPSALIVRHVTGALLRGAKCLIQHGEIVGRSHIGPAASPALARSPFRRNCLLVDR